MTFDAIFDELKKFDSVMELNKPLTKGQLQEFQNSNGIIFPQAYTNMLEKFDGGEIFIPGTVLYGIIGDGHRLTVREIKRKNTRKDFSIPRTYLIFGKNNYGDFICIDLNGQNEIIQWDHESDEEFCRWDNLEAWFVETISDYKRYECGTQQ